MGATLTPAEEVVYPDRDGKRMADNTRQYEWIVTIKGNLDAICVGDRAAFVAGDNLIYPVQGVPTIRTAPDVYVAFGRPRGHRGSYRVWEEDGVFPQVVFEVLSPGNTRRGDEPQAAVLPASTGPRNTTPTTPTATCCKAGCGPAGGSWPSATCTTTSARDSASGSTCSGWNSDSSRPTGEPFLTFAQLKEQADAERRGPMRRPREPMRRRYGPTRRRHGPTALAAKLRELGIDPATL